MTKKYLILKHKRKILQERIKSLPKHSFEMQKVLGVIQLYTTEMLQIELKLKKKI